MPGTEMRQGGDPKALSVPSGFICTIHTQASTIDIYQLWPIKNQQGHFLNAPVEVSFSCLWHTASRHPALSPLLPQEAVPVFPWELSRGKHCAHCSHPCTAAAGRGTPSRPRSGLLSNSQKWITWGDTCADKARDFLGRGARVESSRVREPRRTALPQSRVFW